MQKMIRLTVISFVFSLVFLIPTGVNADPPGMPGSHGSSGDAPPGGGAPIGSGLALIITLSAAYGGKKVYRLNRTE